MCDGIAGSLLSTWTCFFFLCWFQLFLLFLINKTYKIMYRDKFPAKDEALEFTGISGADERDVNEPASEEGIVPTAVVPGKTDSPPQTQLVYSPQEAPSQYMP